METNRNNRNIIFKDVESGKLLSVDFDSIDFQNLKAINNPLKHLSGCGADDDYGDIQVFGSCNGLLCLINKRYRIIELWNISTGDYKVLPDELLKVTGASGEIWYFYGFGYDSINDDYKIVRVAQEIDSRNHTLISEVKVYSLKALQGCLCIITTCFNDEVNIWMMKDYGVKESWTILYSF
ncbi:PREDICTED: F-box protein CPR30 [Theobroma cacao]|uniref:F-box protein CPR30 n=1 Tax=Theobroma cacao TaxID=3641 RepID=A0AB32WP16_THECC|nr:PREDICTED: F-box protein CPR30 [Theobroma cacao]